MTSMLQEAQSFAADLISLRRDLHRIPELAFAEEKTSARVAQALQSLGLSFESGIAKTGVVGEIKVDNALGTLCLRADLDALPIQECNTHDFVSTHPGVSHMCGHDAHMTCLYGAARLLQSHTDKLRYNVKFLFQPSEEKIPGGAPAIMKSGVLDDVDAIFGLHCQPALPVGRFEVCAGPMMAAADRFVICVHGKGGHAATPQLCVDPIITASHLVMQLQTLVSRRISPTTTLVITIGRFTGGDTFNAIPDSVELEGTVRTLNAELHDTISDRFSKVVQQVCESYGCRAEIDYEQGYPPLVNSEAETTLVAQSLRDGFGVEALDFPCEPKMYGEDFSYYLQKIPGCFFMMGVGNADAGMTSSLHSPTFDLDESALAIGTAAMAGIIFDYQKQHAT